jgi:replicative superfamily II helicase
MDEACYDKCVDFVRDDHQVLIFVHSRGATVQLAQFLIQRASMENDSEAFLPPNITHPDYVTAMKSVRTVRNREIMQLFENGIGVHHAGLVRQDRLLMEKLFADGHIKVLCCTATLAWGSSEILAFLVILTCCVFDVIRFLEEFKDDMQKGILMPRSIFQFLIVKSIIF